jgi:polyribonucleotide nucleotidyltransferase
VHVYGVKREGVARALEMIKEMFAEVEVDTIYTGKIVSTTNFGAFMEMFPGKDGMIHISELADFRVNAVEDVVKVGDMVYAKCIGVDDRGRVKLSRKQAMAERGEDAK